MTGALDTEIGNVCMGKSKSAKGFFWESVGIGNTNYLHGNLTKLKRILSKYKDECDLSQIIKILED